MDRLSVTTRCAGACAYTFPLELPEVTLEPDGTLIAVQVAAGEPFRLVFTRGRAPAGLRVRLAGLAAAAGLPAETTPLQLQPGVAVSDGGTTVLSGVVAGAAFRLEAAQLDEGADRYSLDLPRRRSLRAVAQALRDARSSASQVYTPDRVALVAVLDPQAAPDALRWRGAPLNTLAAAIPGVRCAVLPADRLQIAREQLGDQDFDTLVASRGQRWQVRLRPLLPHERGCADLPLRPRG